MELLLMEAILALHEALPKATNLVAVGTNPDAILLSFGNLGSLLVDDQGIAKQQISENAMYTLDGKHILLGVTGGIAAYKSPDIVRRLREKGADVRVVMTSSAEKLVSTTVFQAVSGNPVRCDLWDEDAEAAMGHIELARWADSILIAPVTANVMAQLAAGRADNLLTTICLATETPLFIAPAMNQAMWRNHATQDNRELLESRDVRIIGPAEGEQACGETGPGRMVEPADIVAQLTADSGVANVGLLKGVTLLVTAGPTREPIDPIRFVSNRSSGKMGFAIAQAAVRAGAEVMLIAGPVEQNTPPGVDRIDVETAADMHAATMARVNEVDIFISAAAVSDYRPCIVAQQKIKKTDDNITIEMVRAHDILAEVAALPRRPFLVGFAAETEHLEKYAREKMLAKHLDMIIANLVGADRGFEQETNSVYVITRDDKQELEEMPKVELARKLIYAIAARYTKIRKAPTPLHKTTLST